jgi:hypothetical protein
MRTVLHVGDRCVPALSFVVLVGRREIEALAAEAYL